MAESACNRVRILAALEIKQATLRWSRSGEAWPDKSRISGSVRRVRRTHAMCFHDSSGGDLGRNTPRDNGRVPPLRTLRKAQSAPAVFRPEEGFVYLSWMLQRLKD